jgi:hypothetical protein
LPSVDDLVDGERLEASFRARADHREVPRGQDSHDARDLEREIAVDATDACVGIHGWHDPCVQQAVLDDVTRVARRAGDLRPAIGPRAAETDLAAGCLLHSVPLYRLEAR